MRSKAKLFVTIAAVFLALVASAVAVVAVLAAKNVTVSTQDIKIEYKAENVVGSVKGYYKFDPSEGSSVDVSTFTSLDDIVYTGDEASDPVPVETWNFTGITGITRSNNALYILYEFTNASNAYNAECTYTNTTSDNIKVSYCYKTGNGNYGTYTELAKDGKFDFDVPTATVSGGTITNGVASCIVKIEVVKVNFNATLTGASFSWTLGYGAST